MQNRRLPWLLSIPLMAGGCLGAHSAAHRLVEPSTPQGMHGYLAPAPLVIAIGVAVGLVVALRSVLAGTQRGGAPSYLFALLPPLSFAIQEHLERAVQDGARALELALEPAFLLGLALQLPFALCSLVLARSLFRVAEAACGRLLDRGRSLRRSPTVVVRPPLLPDLPRVPVLASPQAGRAPPPYA
jgi:hypothetical protein